MAPDQSSPPAELEPGETPITREMREASRGEQPGLLPETPATGPIEAVPAADLAPGQVIPHPVPIPEAMAAIKTGQATYDARVLLSFIQWWAKHSDLRLVFAQGMNMMAPVPAVIEWIGIEHGVVKTEAQKLIDHLIEVPKPPLGT